MPKKTFYWILVGCLLIALAGCSGAPDPTEVAPPAAEEEAAADEAAPEDTPVPATEAAPTEEPTPEEEVPAMEMTITSPAFGEGDPIPIQFSCDGENVSPELVWEGIPEGTASLVFILDDPDAPGGTWDHWILFDIPADLAGLPQGGTAGTDGNNSWGQTGYGGPCPPGGTHRYFFKLYALDSTLGLAAGTTKGAVEAAMDGHILAQAELMGTYSR